MPEAAGRTRSYLTLFESSPIPMARLDVEGRVAQANRALAALLGYGGPEELSGVFLEDLLDDSDEKGGLALVECGRSKDDSMHLGERRFLSRDGRVRWMLVSSTCIRQQGEADSYMVMMPDVTAQKELELRLRASEERAHGLFENASEGITMYRVIRDEKGRVRDLTIEAVNPAQERGTGTSRDKLVGQRVTDIYEKVPSMRPYFDVTRRVIEEGVPQRFEVHFDIPGIDYIASIYPVEPDLWVAVGMDVTPLRRAERELEAKDEAIRQAYEDVFDAVTGGKLGLMTEDEIQGELGEPLGPERLVTDASEVSEVRRAVSRDASSRFPEASASHRLSTALGEALTNVVKHAGAGASRAFAKDCLLQVLVSDNGPGIDFRQLPKATLVPGYSSAHTLGLGFTLMLQLTDRMLLTTRSGRTLLVLEFDTKCLNEMPEPDGS